MTCPHCLDRIHEAWNQTGTFSADHTGTYWQIHHMRCPACSKLIAKLIGTAGNGARVGDQLIIPKGVSRAPLSPDVPNALAADYAEACLVLADSPKASAALSRRCLQHLLREHAGVKPSTLDNEIQQILDATALPSHLSETIDTVRVVGNWAAHPIKSKTTGEVVDVEPGEAEWLLETLEALFDFYFVQPSILRKRKDAINAKLTEAGKPPLK